MNDELNPPPYPPPTPDWLMKAARCRPSNPPICSTAEAYRAALLEANRRRREAEERADRFERAMNVALGASTKGYPPVKDAAPAQGAVLRVDLTSPIESVAFISPEAVREREERARAEERFACIRALTGVIDQYIAMPASDPHVTIERLSALQTALVALIGRGAR